MNKTVHYCPHIFKSFTTRKDDVSEMIFHPFLPLDNKKVSKIHLLTLDDYIKIRGGGYTPM